MQLTEDFGLLLFAAYSTPFESMMSQKVDLLVSLIVIVILTLIVMRMRMKMSCVWGERRPCSLWQRRVFPAADKNIRPHRTCAFLLDHTTLSCAEKECPARACNFQRGGQCSSTLRTKRVFLCQFSMACFWNWVFFF